MFNIDANILKKNLESLNEKENSEYAQLSLKASTIDLRVYESRDLNKTFAVVENNKEKLIHSKYYPEMEAKRWIDELNFKKNAIIIVFGLGYGYHVREILKKDIEFSKLIIIEPFIEIFKSAIENVDLSDIFKDDRVLMVLGNESYVFALGDNLSWMDIEDIAYFTLPTYIGIMQSDMKKMLSEIRRFVLNQVIQRNTIMHNSERWQRNIFKNYKYISKSWNSKSFFNKFIDIPAFIVSAGPSLNKNVSLLKEVQGKGLIISVDTALKVLVKEGITPDFVVSLDGHIKNYEKFKDINYDAYDLVYLPTVNNNILDAHKGRKIIASAYEGVAAIIYKDMDIGFLQTGGSVANSALDFARRLGSKTIVFVGQDLAYTNDLTHATGSMYDDQKNKIVISKSDYFYVNDVDGNRLPTTGGLLSFKNWFENYIKMDNDDVIYIDATEGGAYIEGTKVLTLRSVIDSYIDSTHNLIEIKESIFNNESFIYDNKEGLLLERLREYKNNLDDLKFEVSEGVKAAKKLKSIFDSKITNKQNKINRILHLLDAVDEQIKLREAEIGLISVVLQPVIYNALNSNHIELEDKNEDAIRISERTLRFYKEIVDSVEFATELIDELIVHFENNEKQSI